MICLVDEGAELRIGARLIGANVRRGVDPVKAGEDYGLLLCRIADGKIIQRYQWLT
jgi:hypothetical protein